MPKLYEYFGLHVFFYSCEHDPVHVHGVYQGAECRAELIVQNGEIVAIRFCDIKGRRPLDASHFSDFKKLVSAHAQDILDKWVAFFVLHKPVASERITRRLT
jgi:hypothetical protein